MNTRLNNMLQEGVIPNRGGVWIDCYNQTTSDIAGTILAGMIDKNHYFVTMEQSILTPKRTEKAKELRRQGINSFEDTELQPREDGISNSLTSLDEDNLLIEAINTEPDGVSRTIKAQYDQTSIANFNRTDAFTATGVIEQMGRGFNRGGQHEECPTITRNSWENNNFLNQNFRIRKLTERECETQHGA